VRVRVYHGCDTGCKVVPGSPPQDLPEWAREFVERIIREKWPECLVSIDWDSMVVEAEPDHD